MSSRNPVLRKIDAPVVSDEELARIVNGPSVAGQASFVDVISKTAIIFALIVVGAIYGWTTSVTTSFDGTYSYSNTGVILTAMIVALVTGIVNAFKKNVSPALVLIYGAAEGILLGAISHWIDLAYGPGIAQQAVIATMVVFGLMLGLYKSRIIKVNGKFMKMFTIAMISYFVIAIASFISSLFGVGQGWGFFGVGQIGMLLCVFGVGLAAFSLVVDFEVTTQALAAGVPQREAWRLAFGLVVSLVWLYTELLRLLAIVNGRD